MYATFFPLICDRMAYVVNFPSSLECCFCPCSCTHSLIPVHQHFRLQRGNSIFHLGLFCWKVIEFIACLVQLVLSLEQKEAVVSYAMSTQPAGLGNEGGEWQLIKKRRPLYIVELILYLRHILVLFILHLRWGKFEMNYLFLKCMLQIN